MPFLIEGEKPALDKQEPFVKGVNDEDPGNIPMEVGFTLPTPTGAANWVYYDITLGCMLDSGIVVHRRLPQVDRTADTLASCDISDPSIDRLTGRGVNLISNDEYTDIIQRMAHSQYWFRLWGQALRIREQVPIPRLLKISGVDAVPHDNNPQWAFNKIVGNYSGQVLYHAQWSLWYTLATAPKSQQVPPQNLAQHVSASVLQKDDMQSPWSQPDDLAANKPPTLQTGILRSRE